MAPFAAVTDYSAYVSGPEELSHHLRQAFRAAVSGTPRPAHLDLQGIDGGGVVNVEAELEVVVERQFARLPPFRPVADRQSIAAALDLLKAARRPVIVAGGGVAASDARAELVELAEKLSVPVATALNAKAMFPADHRLAVGVPGSYSRACANQIVCEADLVFFIGSHTGGQVSNNYTVPPGGRPRDSTRYQCRGDRPQLSDSGGFAWRRARDAARDVGDGGIGARQRRVDRPRTGTGRRLAR